MAKTKEKDIAVVDKDLIQIEEIKKGVGDLVIRMGAVKIKTQADYDLAVELGKEGGNSVKELEKAAIIAIAPYQKSIDAATKITKAVKAITQSIKNATDPLREQCKKFIREEEEKKQKALQELAKKEAAAQAAAQTAETPKEAAKAEKKVETIQTTMELTAAKKTDNSTRFRKVEIIDENLVPREYLSVDMTKLNAAKGKVGTPIPEIAGVRIFDDVQVRL